MSVFVSLFFFLKERERSERRGERGTPFFKPNEAKRKSIDHARPKFLYGKKKKRVINVVFRNDEAFPSRARKEKNDFNRVPCSF